MEKSENFYKSWTTRLSKVERITGSTWKIVKIHRGSDGDQARDGCSRVGGRGWSIVTYIKIPISRLLITSTIYHAKRGWELVRFEVPILQTAGDLVAENLESRTPDRKSYIK